MSNGNNNPLLFLDISTTKEAIRITNPDLLVLSQDDPKSPESVGSGVFDKTISELDSLSFISSDLRLTTLLADYQHKANKMPENNHSISPLNQESIVAGVEFLVWNNPNTPASPKYPVDAKAPFVVLMESTTKALNVGKLSPIKIADLVGEVTQGDLKIQRSGQNQVKITCSERITANSLIDSEKLRDKNYRVVIPNSIAQKRGLIREVDTDCSALSIADRITETDKNKLISIKRRVASDNTILDTMELTFESQELPENILIKKFEFPITPIIPRPTRCFNCQRYRHFAGQCRSKARCEFCGESHLTDECTNTLRNPNCCNCSQSHVASSKDCPIYKFQDEVVKIKFENNCSYKEAENLYKQRKLQNQDSQVQSRENRMEISTNSTNGQSSPPNQIHPFENSTDNDTIHENASDLLYIATSSNPQFTSTPTKINPTRNLNSPEKNENAPKKPRRHLST